MRLHEVLTRFSDIIRSYEVVQYEIANLNSRLKLKIVFANGTELYVRDILLDGRRRKYAFHWQEGSGRLIARWDNAAHWPEIETFPYHKHIGEDGQVVASEGTTLDDQIFGFNSARLYHLSLRAEYPPLTPDKFTQIGEEYRMAGRLDELRDNAAYGFIAKRA